MNTILGELGKNPKFCEYIKTIENKKSPIAISGLTDVGMTQMISATREFAKRPILVITYNEIQAQKILKDIKYFNTFINEDLARVKKFSDKLENGEVKEDRILPVKSKVHDLKLGIMIAGYSKGDELTLLEEEYLDLLAEWEEVWEPEYYNKNLKMISLGILFQVDRAFVKKVKNMLKKSNINDWLYNFLLDSLDGEQIEVSKERLFPNTFTTLQRVVYEENKIELLKKYLNNDWYNEDCGCYEAHKSKQNIYYGYWSFEAGAIAKILKINDTQLRDTQYYPYDMVHYKE